MPFVAESNKQNPEVMK